jgi:hypothetical protein
MAFTSLATFMAVVLGWFLMPVPAVLLVRTRRSGCARSGAASAGWAGCSAGTAGRSARSSSRSACGSRSSGSELCGEAKQAFVNGEE